MVLVTVAGRRYFRRFGKWLDASTRFHEPTWPNVRVIDIIASYIPTSRLPLFVPYNKSIHITLYFLDFPLTCTTGVFSLLSLFTLRNGRSRYTTIIFD